MPKHVCHENNSAANENPMSIGVQVRHNDDLAAIKTSHCLSQRGRFGMFTFLLRAKTSSITSADDRSVCAASSLIRSDKPRGRLWRGNASLTNCIAANICSSFSHVRNRRMRRLVDCYRRCSCASPLRLYALNCALTVLMGSVYSLPEAAKDLVHDDCTPARTNFPPYSSG